MTKVFIVEDHPTVRAVLRELLEREPDIVVCGEAATATAALEAAPQSEADLVLADIMLPGMNGIELVQALRRHRPDLPLAMFTAYGAKQFVEGALKAGARGYLLKANAEELPAAIRQIVQGGTYLSPALPRW